MNYNTKTHLQHKITIFRTNLPNRQWQQSLEAIYFNGIEMVKDKPNEIKGFQSKDPERELFCKEGASQPGYWIPRWWTLKGTWNSTIRRFQFSVLTYFWDNLFKLVPWPSSWPSTYWIHALEAFSSYETTSYWHYSHLHTLSHRRLSAILTAWIEIRWGKSTAPVTGESQQ